MASSAQVPSVYLMAVFATQEQIGLQSAFDHVRCPPLAGEQRVESQMPPEIVLKKLGAAVHLPLAQDVKCLAIEHENAAWAIAIGCPKGADVNTFRPTVNSMRTRIIGTRQDFFRFDHLDDLRLPRIRLCVYDMHTRRAQPRHNQVTSLDVRVR